MASLAHAVEALPPVVRALLRPESYPHPADDIRLHETHISWVVLAGPYAYKVKKPVDFGFLDFSSVERRAVACADEVHLNRRLCPDVYLGVTYVVARDPPGGVPDTGAHDGRLSEGTQSGGAAGATYAVGGPGRPVEPMVWMRRLPATGMLPALLANDAVDARLVRRLAQRLARFHATAATGPGVDEYGSLAAMRAHWAENFRQAAPFVGRSLPGAAQQAIVAFVERMLSHHADLFAQRVAAGRIREGHGDLHAASVCVEGRRLYFFDCIEFNRRFRCADVAADAAFLAMDLDHHGRADLAAAFVDAYVRESGDRELRPLLPFYMCYRAYVRGKVLSFRLDEAGLAPPQRAAIEGQAQAYFDLAWAYAAGLAGRGRPAARHVRGGRRADAQGAVAPQEAFAGRGAHGAQVEHGTLAAPGVAARPVLVATMGLPASGKTTLAHALAARLGLVHLSSDTVRKELAGLRPTEHCRVPFGTGLYNPATTRRTYAALRRRAGQWLRAGRSVVLDATFGRAAERLAAQRLAARHGVPLVALVCRADDATLRARLAGRAADARTHSDARLDLWPALRASFAEPVTLPGAATVVELDTTAPPAATLEPALAAVRAAYAAPADRRSRRAGRPGRLGHAA